MRREGHLERALAHGAGQGVELQLEPAAVVGAHVHRQGLGHRTQAARLVGAVDPDFEGEAGAVVADLANKQGEVTARGVEHVSPCHVAVRHFGAPRPAQAGQHGRGQGLDRQALVGVGDLDVMRLLLVGARRDRQHRTQHGVGAIGGQALEAVLPRGEVEILEFAVGVVLGHVHRLRDRGVDIGRDHSDHVLVRLGGDFQGGDEGLGQIVDVAAEVAVEAPGVVLDCVFLEGAVGHALAPGVGVGEGRFDAVGGVVGEGQADGAGGGDGQQVRVADAVLADLVLDLGRQTRGKVAARQVEVGVEEREGAAFTRQLGRGEIGAVAHVLGDLAAFFACFRRVVTLAQHDERVAQPGEAQAHATLGVGLVLLLLERPVGDFEHVVEHADRHVDDLAKAGVVELGLVGKRVLDEGRQVDRAQAAAAIGRQRLFGARVGGLDGLAVVQVVVLVHAVEEQDARLGVVVGRAHDLVPQLARAHLAVHPHGVVALVGAGLLDLFGGLGLVHEFDEAVGLDGLHEGVGDADRDVEVGEVAVVLGVDEVLDVRVVAAQHAHLRATTGAGRFHRLARAVEHAHVGHRAGGVRCRALDQRALGADGGEVIAHTATAAHGFGGLGECGVDAGAAVDRFGDRVTHRLHEAVDQRGGQRRTRGAVDAAGGDEAFFLGFEKARFPMCALVFSLDHGEGAGDALAQLGD